MTRGRAMFGSGPGALPSDARTHGIDPVLLRDRQDEALGIIIRLLRGEDRFTYESEWFELHDAQLQLLPLQEDMPMATASSISPSGMQLAGKYGIGVLSIASNSTEGIQALPTQWGFAEEAAAIHGSTVDRRDWRVLMAFHLAETREQARAEAVHGLHRWHNEYNVWTLGRPGAVHVEDAWELLDRTTQGGAEGAGAAVVGTPDDLVAAIRHLQELTGGFGVVLGFAHDWANREATMRSWELVARYVVPELNGYTDQPAPLPGVPAREPGRPDGWGQPGRDEQDHGPRRGGQGDGHDDRADGRPTGRRPGRRRRSAPAPASDLNRF